jgi:O-antigen ligase
MWSEIGILGLAAFLSAIFVVLKRILQDLSRKIKSSSEGFVLLGALAGYVAFLLQSGLDTNLYSLRLTTLFWAMTAYMLSVNKVLEE